MTVLWLQTTGHSPHNWTWTNWIPWKLSDGWWKQTRFCVFLSVIRQISIYGTCTSKVKQMALNSHFFAVVLKIWFIYIYFRIKSILLCTDHVEMCNCDGMSALVHSPPTLLLRFICKPTQACLQTSYHAAILQYKLKPLILQTRQCENDSYLSRCETFIYSCSIWTILDNCGVALSQGNGHALCY